MKAKLRSVIDNGVKYKALMFVCPGCEAMDGHTGLHMLPVNCSEIKNPSWNWNWNLETPTLSPSILSNYGDGQICHSFLNNGIFTFLPDSTHKYAGMEIPLPDLPEWV